MTKKRGADFYLHPTIFVSHKFTVHKENMRT